MDFFRSLFRRNTQVSLLETAPHNAAFSDEKLSKMQFQELMKVLESLSPTANAHDLISIMRRSYEIALVDNHVPDEHREASLKLAEAVTADLEKSLANNPTALAAMRAANSHMKEYGRRAGVGSLIWQLNEYSVPDGETIQHIMKQGNRHLVPDFLAAHYPEIPAKLKYQMVRQLILQSVYETKNSVLILHGIAASGDAAATAIFTAEEYYALLNVPDDYESGRKVLVRLGILPEVSEASSFMKAIEITESLSVVIQKILIIRTASSEADLRLKALSEKDKYTILLALAFLRIEITRATVCQIYGKNASYDVASLYTDPLLIAEASRFSETAKALKNLGAGAPLDFILLDHVMNIGGREINSEDQFNQIRDFFDIAVRWLNEERVEFLAHLRRMLQHSPHHDVEDCVMP